MSPVTVQKAGPKRWKKEGVSGCSSSGAGGGTLGAAAGLALGRRESRESSGGVVRVVSPLDRMFRMRLRGSFLGSMVMWPPRMQSIPAGCGPESGHLGAEMNASSTKDGSGSENLKQS